MIQCEIMKICWKVKIGTIMHLINDHDVCLNNDWAIFHSIQQTLKLTKSSRGGGGGGGYSPTILVGMCRSKVKIRPGLRNELHGRAWKCGAPERAWAVLSVKLGLRTKLEPFWAWKCGSPELPGRVWLALWPAANPGRCRTAERFAFRLSRPWDVVTGWN